MPARTLPVVDLPTAVPRIFDQVQTSTANHQKNFVALHKLHLEAARRELPGEREFETLFFSLLARVLPVKKGTTTADRVVKFVGGYTKFVNERGASAEQEDDSDELDNDTTASRFSAKLLKFLLRGFQAKDKVVRYRVIFLAAEMIVDLGEMDMDIWDRLRAALLERIHDREAMVRVQVVIGLSKLAASEDPSEVEAGEKTLVQVLMETLESDPSHEVRRAALVNIPANATTLPAILKRARDTETTIRKLLYSSVLENATLDSDSAAHPTSLTVAQRELVARHGLGDREKTVRAAAADLLGHWVTALEDKTKPEEELASRMTDIDISGTDENRPLSLDEKRQKLIDTLTNFLKRFDVLLESPVGGELQGGELASMVLKSVFDTRSDIFEDLYFGDAYFADPSPEKIFLARVFVDHCVSPNREDKGHGDERMESVGIPVVTSCAFRIQHGYNALVDVQNGVDADDREEKEFIVSEMLKLAVNLDYADEIGRRKMFSLVRDMLTRPTLPMDLVPRCLDVLRQLSSDERDLIRVVVEIIQDLRDPGDEEEDPAANQTQDTIVNDPDGAADTSFGSDDTAAPKKPPRVREDMSPEEQSRLDMIDMRCLSLCIGMLERVNGTLDENSTLQGILSDLIIPSVQRKDQEPRKQGLIALGLFCIIAKPLALKTLPLFISQAEENIPEAFRMSILQIIFDLLMIHERTFLAPGTENAEQIVTFLIAQLEKESDRDDTSPKVLALLSTGIAKLLMCAMITDEKAVKSLLMVYFSPYNAENQELKQCLTFFAGAYSHSSQRNQRVMGEIFTYMFRKLSTLRQDIEDDEDINLSSVTAMWLDWTDPFHPTGQPSDAAGSLIQFEMANDIIRALLTEKMTKEDKRILCQMLGKLHIPDEVDVDKVRTLKLLIDNVSSRRPLGDSVAKNALKKFESTIVKKFEKELEGFSEADYRQFEKLKDLFDFLDDIVPDDDDETINSEVKKKGKKRRSGSITSNTTDRDDDVSVASSRRGKSKPKTKKRRLSTSDDEESDFDDDDNGTAKGTPPPPTRRLPKRSAAKKAELIEISSDDDEDDDDLEATPAPRKGRGSAGFSLSRWFLADTPTRDRTRQAAEEEARIDADIDDLLEEESTSEIPHDSIMDDSDEEDEVFNDLLADD
ncbi:nuclear condensing complex subunit [Mycena vitilis]|nr:nuclear condensing complex subunit [Mycena vitilis]